MGIKQINIIREWFRTAKKPTQAQFWDWLDSFWHKSEKIAISAIDGLQSILNNKAETSQLDGHIDNKENPHGVTAGQVGAATTEQLNDEITARQQADSELSQTFGDAVNNEIEARQAADTEINRRIDDLSKITCIRDNVDTFADLNALDTSNIRTGDSYIVEIDESWENKSSIYTWNGDAWGRTGEWTIDVSIEAISGLREELDKYVTLDTEQTITGNKAFDGLFTVDTTEAGGSLKITPTALSVRWYDSGFYADTEGVSVSSYLGTTRIGYNGITIGGENYGITSAGGALRIFSLQGLRLDINEGGYDAGSVGVWGTGTTANDEDSGGLLVVTDRKTGKINADLLPETKIPANVPIVAPDDEIQLLAVDKDGMPRRIDLVTLKTMLENV